MSSSRRSEDENDELVVSRAVEGMNIPPEMAAPPAFTRPITVPLLVRGGFDKRLLGVVLGVSACLVAVGVWFRVKNLGDAAAPVVMWVIAAAIALPFLAVALWRWPRQRWVEVAPTGFVLNWRGGARSFDDDQVVGLARRSAVGLGNVTEHRIELEVRDGPPVGFAYSVSPGAADPMAVLWTRLVRHLSHRLRGRLDQGERLAGDGWHVDASGLHHGQGVLTLDQISMVGWFERRLCVWKDDEERACLRLPLVSRNVWPLGDFLFERVRTRPGFPRLLPGKPLGRVILERGTKGWVPGLLGLAAGLLVGGSMLVYALPGGTQMLNWLVYIAVGILALAFLGGYSLLRWCLNGPLIFHEFGVVQRPWRGAERSLLYHEIGTVTWTPGPRIALRPLPGLDRPEIRYFSSNMQEDEDWVNMRTRVCINLAMRWRKEVQEGAVAWTPRLRFLPAGLEYHPSRMIGSGEPVQVPYVLTSYQIVTRSFNLFVAGRNRPVCVESIGRANFFPGLLLLNMIYGELRQKAAPGDRSPAPRLPAPPRDDRVTGDEAGFRP